MTTPSEALAHLGLELIYVKPAGSYKTVSIVGQVAHTAGHLGIKDGKPTVVGKLGADLSIEEGQAAARDAVLAALGSLEQELGSLDRITGVVKLFGMVNATPEFGDHPAVINGASDLLVELFGKEAGTHARSAMGAGSLPFGTAVELELVVTFK